MNKNIVRRISTDALAIPGGIALSEVFLFFFNPAIQEVILKNPVLILAGLALAGLGTVGAHIAAENTKNQKPAPQ